MRLLRQLFVAIGVGALIATVFRLYELLSRPSLAQTGVDETKAEVATSTSKGSRESLQEKEKFDSPSIAWHSRLSRRQYQELASLSSRSLLVAVDATP